MSAHALKDFLKDIGKHSTLVKSRFVIDIISENNSVGDIPMTYITDINIPGRKLTQSTLYYLGQEYDIPVVYNFDRDFTLTVLADAELKNYNWFCTNMPVGGNRFDDLKAKNKLYTIKVYNNTSDIVHLPIKIDGKIYPYQQAKGWSAYLTGCYFKTISELAFSNSSSDLMTFTVGGFAREISLNGIK